MHYLIWLDDDVLWHAEANPSDEAWLRETVLPHLQPLADDAYINGPLAILSTAARYSYALDGTSVLWLVEWDPGLLVLQFSSDGGIAWASARSPVPGFGGRPIEPGEADAYDEDARNPQYHLVFDAWDAQFDEDDREGAGFSVAPPEVEARWRQAMAHAQRLGEQLNADIGQDESLVEAWQARCKQSPLWIGAVAD